MMDRLWQYLSCCWWQCHLYSIDKLNKHLSIKNSCIYNKMCIQVFQVLCEWVLVVGHWSLLDRKQQDINSIKLHRWFKLYKGIKWKKSPHLSIFSYLAKRTKSYKWRLSILIHWQKCCNLYKTGDAWYINLYK